jgi:hypothetical protein
VAGSLQPRMEAVLHRRQMSAALRRNPGKTLLGDVPEFPLVPMECVVEGVHPMMAGFRSTQALREPADRRRRKCRGWNTAVREIWRFVRYVGLGFREFFVCNACTSPAARWASLRRNEPGKIASADGAGSPSSRWFGRTFGPRGSPGVVERILETLCATRMGTPAAARWVGI